MLILVSLHDVHITSFDTATIRVKSRLVSRITNMYEPHINITVILYIQQIINRVLWLNVRDKHKWRVIERPYTHPGVTLVTLSTLIPSRPSKGFKLFNSEIAVGEWITFYPGKA